MNYSQTAPKSAAGLKEPARSSLLQENKSGLSVWCEYATYQKKKKKKRTLELIRREFQSL